VPGMPSAVARFFLEAAFVALVAAGAVLAKLEPVAMVALIVVACVLVALVERAYVREAARRGERSAAPGADQAAVEPGAPGDVEADEAAPGQSGSEPQPEPEPQAESEPELAVSERSARAILASGPPSLPEPPAREAELSPERDPEPVFEPEPERVSVSAPERDDEPTFGGPPREWSIWELERLVRERRDDPRREEWAALVLSLRDFARVDGMLPLEFDKLVRESFGPLLAGGGTRTEAPAAS
jgi:hypothetical protein